MRNSSSARPRVISVSWSRRRTATASAAASLVSALTPSGGARILVEPAEVARRLAYLEGGLTVVEVEGPGKRAVLKSAVVRREGGTRQFLEVRIDPVDGITLAHYRYDDAAGNRKGIACPMTYDTLDRLVSDLLDVLQDEILIRRPTPSPPMKNPGAPTGRDARERPFLADPQGVMGPVMMV